MNKTLLIKKLFILIAFIGIIFGVYLGAQYNIDIPSIIGVAIACAMWGVIFFGIILVLLYALYYFIFVWE
jgi:hypothetical protein